MLVASRPEEFNNVVSGDMRVCTPEPVWSSSLSLSEKALSDASLSEDTQESGGSPWAVDICAGAHQTNRYGVHLIGETVASENGIPPRRSLYVMDGEKMVLEPSAMETNVPYRLDVSGVVIWAVKDSADDVIFFELGE